MKRMAGLLLALALLVVPFAIAAPSAAEVTATTDKGTASVSTTPTTTVDVNAGHVYEANVTVTKIAGFWAGIYGRITQSIVLGTFNGTANDILYEWTGDATGLKAVYLAEGTDVNFAATMEGNLTSTDLVSLGVWTDITNVGLEAIENFSLDTNLSDGVYCDSFTAFNMATDEYPRYVITNSAGTTQWITCYVAQDNDGTAGLTADDEIVVAGNVVPGGTAFDGSTVDYQVMVPVQGDASLGYYVWVE